MKKTALLSIIVHLFLSSEAEANYVLKEIPAHLVKKFGIVDPKQVKYEPSHQFTEEDFKIKPRNVYRVKEDDEIQKVPKNKIHSEDLSEEDINDLRIHYLDDARK